MRSFLHTSRGRRWVALYGTAVLLFALVLIVTSQHPLVEWP